MKSNTPMRNQAQPQKKAQAKVISQTVTKQTILWWGLLAALFAVFVLHSTPALADRYVHVSSSGELKAWPDFVRIDLTIEAEAKTAADAKKRVDGAANKVLDIAAELGIEKTDIIAARISNNPVYDWSNNKRVIRGEQVSRSVQLTLRNIEQYTQLTHQLVQVADVQINHSQTGFNDASDLVMQATDLALKQAQEKAERMAKTLGHRLGKVISIEEQGANVATPALMQVRMMSAEADSMPKAAPMVIQQQTISSNVSVRFELK